MGAASQQSHYKCGSPSPFFFQPRFPILLPSFTLDLMSSSHHSDRPERSRNAKAQARHRAKRKAYIEQVFYPFSDLVDFRLIPPSARTHCDQTADGIWLFTRTNQRFAPSVAQDKRARTGERSAAERERRTTQAPH